VSSLLPLFLPFVATSLPLLSPRINLCSRLTQWFPLLNRNLWWTTPRKPLLLIASLEKLVSWIRNWLDWSSVILARVFFLTGLRYGDKVWSPLELFRDPQQLRDYLGCFLFCFCLTACLFILLSFGRCRWQQNWIDRWDV
jgi:hypothetical protein